jgi:urease accessory protein
MALGGLLGMVGISVPFVEFGILASVLGLGVFVAAAMKLPLPVTLAIAAVFALFHGHAHGAEMPAMTSGWAYAAGFVIATLALHASGLAAGLAFKTLSSPMLTRLAGVGVAACALWLILF